jgi:hypothetical protein
MSAAIDLTAAADGVAEPGADASNNLAGGVARQPQRSGYGRFSNVGTQGAQACENRDRRESMAKGYGAARSRGAAVLA